MQRCRVEDLGLYALGNEKSTAYLNKHANSERNVANSVNS